MKTPLVRADTFIRATRETGYRSASQALAELVDNSIQANAREIQILVSHVNDSLEISVVDDGVGMSREELRESLQFGGSSRFDSRHGQGRFGMGLPNASLSQARRVDVYTWGERQSPLHTYLDLDALADQREGHLPAVRASVLPNPIRQIAAPRGTAVIWSKCDRVGVRRIETLIRHLQRELGRIFRTFLVQPLKMRVNGAEIRAIDPVRIIPAPPRSGSVAVFPAVSFPFAVNSHTSDVRVTFSALPVTAWSVLTAQEKRAYGITGAPTISILRAGREIASGWYLMGTKRKENYDDWWRCEIAFEPPLDELFGVSHSKQGIRPTAALFDTLAPTLEAQARLLNRQVREAFLSERTRIHSATSVATAAHHKLAIGVETKALRARANKRTLSPSYSLRVSPAPDGAFLSAQRRSNTLTVLLNANHPFHERVYTVLRKEASHSVRDSLDLLLLSFARVLVSASSNDRTSWLRLVDQWSDAMALLLEEKHS